MSTIRKFHLKKVYNMYQIALFAVCLIKILNNCSNEIYLYILFIYKYSTEGMEGKRIKASQSENLKLVCPLHGAFHTVAVKWQHTAGLEATPIRIFATKILYLTNITYQDWGKYICTVKFNECGKPSVREWTTYISLLVHGKTHTHKLEYTCFMIP